MPVTTYGIIVFHSPNVRLQSEGLGRLLGSFLEAARKRQDVAFTIVCASWSKAGLISYLREEGIAVDGLRFITPGRIPIALRMLEVYRRWFRRPRGLGRFRRWLIAGPRLVKEWVWRFVESIIASRSLPVVVSGILLSLLVLAVAAPFLLLVVIGALVAWFIRRVLGTIRRARALRGVRDALRQSGRGHARPMWLTDLYQAIERAEVDALVAAANRQRDVRAWYAPTAFWPQWTRLIQPHLICLPDIVLSDAPAGFALQDAGGRFLQTLTRIEETIAAGTSFSTYSRHVADTILQQRFGVSGDRIAVIPHAPACLDRWVEIRGTRDDVMGTQEYARRLLRAALTKATNEAYIAGFANTRVRFLFYASQFRPSKNVLGLLSVYQRLLRRHYIPLKLILTGDPEALPEIGEFIATHRLERDVLCLRNLTSPELAACYKLAELAVNPTFSEGGCPFTLTEALSVGTPVIMSAIEVTTEVVTDPELQRLMLFDPRDLAAMEERILWGLHHREELLAAQLPLYQRLTGRTWDQVVDEHVLALERVVGQRDAARQVQPAVPLGV